MGQESKTLKRLLKQGERGVTYAQSQNLRYTMLFKELMPSELEWLRTLLKNMNVEVIDEFC